MLLALSLESDAGSVEQSELMRFESLRLWRERMAESLRRTARELEELAKEITP
jgi:hypothetical protein